MMAITISFSEQQKDQIEKTGAMIGMGTRVFNHDGTEIKDITQIDIKIRGDDVVYAVITVALDKSQGDIILSRSE